MNRTSANLRKSIETSNRDVRSALRFVSAPITVGHPVYSELIREAFLRFISKSPDPLQTFYQPKS